MRIHRRDNVRLRDGFGGSDRFGKNRLHQKQRHDKKAQGPFDMQHGFTPSYFFSK